MEFTDKEQIFYNKYVGTFDTPKKLNRSTLLVPDNILEAINTGTFGSTDLKKLGSLLPVFVYKTCVTIHGNIPPIQVSRIGMYKNVIQNKNGSLELRYSAIDHAIKKEIKSHLNGSNWRTNEDSTHGIYFVKSFRTADRTEALNKLAELKNEVLTFAVDGLKAKVCCSGYAYFGMYYLDLCVFPLLIENTPINIASQLTGISVSELEANQKQRQAEITAREQKHTEQLLLKEQALKEAENLVSNLLKVKLSDKVGSVYIVPTVSTALKPIFRAYRIDGKGSFGRVTVSTCLSNTPTIDSAALKPFLGGKQVKLSELTQKQVYLLQ
jgi:hypothetical protein